VNEPREVIELGDGRIFIAGQMTIRGTASGAEVTGPPFGQIGELRDGLIARIDNYSDLAEARRAAGLPEAENDG
jgi:hypothetical protein